MSTRFTQIWQQLRRNRPALWSLFFIGGATFLAFFGYLIAPDRSPNADLQIPEIALREPGFRTELLPVFLNFEVEKTNFWQKMWAGEPLQHKFFAVEDWKMVGDSIYFKKTSASKMESLHLLHLLFPIQDSILKKDNYFIFKDLKGNWQQFSSENLSSRDVFLEHLGRQQPTVLRTFWLGTDKFGRCMLSRLMLGFRVSLLVGLLAVAISLLLGTLLGLLAGYFGGWVDDFISLIINVVWSIPTLLLVFAIVLAMGRGIGIIFVAVGLTMWVEVARLVRGQTIALREMLFVEAARCMGFGQRRVIFRHILPNLLGPVIVMAAVNFATAILVESGLSFLGFGVQPPMPSWGSMLHENYGFALSGKAYLAMPAAASIVLSVLAFNLLGNALRDAFDVRTE